MKKRKYTIDDLPDWSFTDGIHVDQVESKKSFPQSALGVLLSACSQFKSEATRPMLQFEWPIASTIEVASMPFENEELASSPPLLLFSSENSIACPSKHTIHEYRGPLLLAAEALGKNPIMAICDAFKVVWPDGTNFFITRVMLED